MKLTGYNAFQRDSFTCILETEIVHRAGTLSPTECAILYSYVMVTVLPLKRTDPPVHVLNIYCPPKPKDTTFADIFSPALKVAGRDPLLIVGDFNAPCKL